MGTKEKIETKYRNRFPADFKIETINKWLDTNRNLTNSLVHQTPCPKWRNWLKYKSHIFPCLCKQRDEDCFFIELYDELNKISKLHAQDQFCKDAVEQYHKIKKKTEKEAEWLTKYKVKMQVCFDRIHIKYSFDPYETFAIELDSEEFKNIIAYQDIIFDLENPEF